MANFVNFACNDDSANVQNTNSKQFKHFFLPDFNGRF